MKLKVTQPLIDLQSIFSTKVKLLGSDVTPFYNQSQRLKMTDMASAYKYHHAYDIKNFPNILSHRVNSMLKLGRKSINRSQLLQVLLSN